MGAPPPFSQKVVQKNRFLKTLFGTSQKAEVER